MSRLLYQAELHRRGRPTRPRADGGRSPLTESNRRPSPYHGDALPTELRGRREPSKRLHDRRPTRRPVPAPAAAWSYVTRSSRLLTVCGCRCGRPPRRAPGVVLSAVSSLVRSVRGSRWPSGCSSRWPARCRGRAGSGTAAASSSRRCGPSCSSPPSPRCSPRSSGRCREPGLRRRHARRRDGDRGRRLVRLVRCTARLVVRPAGRRRPARRGRPAARLRVVPLRASPSCRSPGSSSAAR